MESQGGTPLDETGLEGPMWQLGLSDGPESYPERPGEPDCNYYLRTGTCGYGDRCRFNHPRDRSVAIGALQASGGEYPERIGQAVCQHYMRTGTCKFGSSCKYHHPRGSSAPVVAFNFYGYPLRPGEEDCAYYVKTGRCKFGANCRFHHPQPAGAELPPPPTMAAPPALPPSAVYPPVQDSPSQQYGNLIHIPRPTMLSSSYISGSYGPIIIPPPGIVTVPSWTPYPVYASDQPTISAGPAYGMSQLSTSTMSYAGPVTSYAGPSREHRFPQRPGEPECQYYLRTGDCKFGSNCKYHHPPELSPPNTGLSISLMGLPLRPGAPICFHYSQNGVCRFGPSCKFDHPIRAISYSSSTSSLTDLPIAPYPVGGSSKNTTMAPSSSTTSSSRLKDDLSSPSNVTSGPISVQHDSNTPSSHGI